MSKVPTLAGLLESFFHHRLPCQRNASPATISSYRDALRLLVLFASQRTGREPCRLELANLDRDVVLAFLDHLEQSEATALGLAMHASQRFGRSSITLR